MASSFKAVLKFGGNEYEIRTASYSFTQLTDEKGRPSSDVFNGHIEIAFVQADDEKLLEWMVDADKKDKGSVVWLKSDEGSTLKELKFEDAYCVAFHEGFSANSPDSMVTTISISARKITIGNVTSETKW
jgi:hypothetical protein